MREACMQIRQLLTKKGGRVVSVRMEETVETAAQMLHNENIGALVIKDVCNTEGDVVVGMFSERDFLRAILNQGISILQMPVSHFMSPRLISCHSNDEISKAVELFNKNGIRHLPVIDRNTLIGVISMRDIVGLYELAASNTSEIAS
jgi:CBS domain-containing protein